MRNSRKKKESRRKDSTTEVGKVNSNGYYTNSEESTEAEIHGFKKDARVKARTSKVEAKTAGKSAVIQAKADLANAKANKRKWLVALLVVGMAVYMFIKSKMIGVG